AEGTGNGPVTTLPWALPIQSPPSPKVSSALNDAPPASVTVSAQLPAIDRRPPSPSLAARSWLAVPTIEVVSTIAALTNTIRARRFVRMAALLEVCPMEVSGETRGELEPTGTR